MPNRICVAMKGAQVCKFCSVVVQIGFVLLYYVVKGTYYVPFDSRRFIGDVITPSSGSKVPNDRKERHPKRETMLSIRLIHNIDKF